MAVLELLRRLVEFLGGVGPVLFGIVLLLVAPYVDRLLVRRKRVSFRVLYNSKIGLSADLDDDADPFEAGPPQLRKVAQTLSRMSIVVIRVRNSGSYDIDPDDFERPLSFTFGGRLVWNARVSDASTPELRRQLRANVRFFRDEDKPAKEDLFTVRRRFSDRMARLLGSAPEQDVREPEWHGVRLDGLRLKRGEKAKLVVVLREPESGRAQSAEGGELTKAVEHGGKLKDAGIIRDDRQSRRVTLPRVSAALVVALSALLVLSQLSVTPDRTIACVPGDLRVEGSTVLMPAMRAIADEYVKACGDDTRITTVASGSIEGVRHVAEGRADIALSDGRSDAHHARLHAEKLAVVPFHVVVNSGAGLNTISLDDLRKVYTGEYTNWNELPGVKTSMPIRIIGRGHDSGTRQLFEQKVLGTGEPELSSNNCLEKDRNPAARVIRCERNGNADVIREISAIPGAIGYADAASLVEERRAGTVTALTLDGETWDPATAVESGYPFWAVEYLYTRQRPRPGSPAAGFLQFAREHPLSQVRLTAATFKPCVTKEGLEELCELR